MKNNFGKIFLIMVLFFIVPILKSADKKKNFFTNFGVGARAMVFKTSFVAMGGNYLAGQLNPAGIGFSRQVLFGVSHSRITFNRQVGFVSAVFPLSRNDKLGLFWKGFLINNIEARSGNTLQPDYLFNNVEQMVGLTYSRKIGGRFAVGFSANLLFQSLDQHYASGWGVDIGLLYAVSEKFSLGASLNDFREKLVWETGYTDHFEKVGSVGISYELTPGAIVAIGYRSKNSFSAATEVEISSPLRLRMGWQDQELALGLGFITQMKSIVFNVNYTVLNHQISNGLSHVFDLNISLKPHSNHRIKKAVVRVERLNIRSGPGVGYAVIAVAKKGQRFAALAERNGWVKIKINRRLVGWVHRKYVKITHTDPL